MWLRRAKKIVKDPAAAFNYTSRGNLVGVISNGTAVLGLGDIGALASKPVMEGKAVLFKKFAGVDVFDIEINEKDPQKLVEVIAALEPTFGAINLEDIKAPDCFYRRARAAQAHEHPRLPRRPARHGDHGGRRPWSMPCMWRARRLTRSSWCPPAAGRRALACLNLLLELGLKRENVFVIDIAGLVYEGREADDEPAKGPLCPGK